MPVLNLKRTFLPLNEIDHGFLFNPTNFHLTHLVLLGPIPLFLLLLFDAVQTTLAPLLEVNLARSVDGRQPTVHDFRRAHELACHIQRPDNAAFVTLIPIFWSLPLSLTAAFRAMSNTCNDFLSEVLRLVGCKGLA